MSQPTAEFQIRFLDYIQRLLDDGTFTATYKFALLMALADLSVEKGQDDDGPLPLHARDVARKFIAYYSRQVRPYTAARASEGGVLHQNTDKQAAVINHVGEAAPLYQARGVQVMARELQQDRDLVGKVTSTVAVMPLWKLQTIARQVDDFLYPNIGKGRDFELRPGIAFCFRRFHGFIYRMAQDGWVRFVRERPQNRELLGETADLAQFMFGTERGSLQPYREILADIQEGRCFYCDDRTGAGHVDHFIPWSWYSLDLGHNFVLACGGCNGKKGDMLAAPRHLDAWLGRNEERDKDLREYFDARHLPHDRAGSLLVAKWAYGRVAAGGGGATWLRGRDFERIAEGDGWRFPGSVGD